jgi:hypothetical protein
MQNSSFGQQHKNNAETVSVLSFIMDWFYVFVYFCTTKITGHIGIVVDTGGIWKRHAIFKLLDKTVMSSLKVTEYRAEIL